MLSLLHMRPRPGPPTMEDPAEKIARLESENAALKNRLDRPRNPLSALPTSPPSTGQPSVQPCEGSPTCQPDLGTDAEEVLHYLKTVLGFTIMHHGNTIRIRSIYSFCENDIFEIEVSNNKLVLKHTDYLNEWTEHLNTYIKTGRSYSAFFAAVTLDLFNKKTFG